MISIGGTVTYVSFLGVHPSGSGATTTANSWSSTVASTSPLQTTELTSSTLIPSPSLTNSATSSSVTQTTTTMPTTVSTGVQAPTHRIGVRVVAGAGQFYYTLTGERFVPRGFNYIKLANQTGMNDDPIFYHSLFNVGLYDPVAAENALESMHKEGYNVVRVFTTGCCKVGTLGDPNGGLNMAYIANLADFIQRAKTNEIFVLVTGDGFPAYGRYMQILDQTWSANFEGNNQRFLQVGGLLASSAYFADFADALLAVGAPTDYIFGYDLINEAFYDTNFAPFSFTSGMITTANGKTYDMSSASSRQQMMEENLIHWVDTLRSVIRERDPTALVTQSLFVPHGPVPVRPGDPREPVVLPLVTSSQLDFVDLHPYQGWTTLPEYMENFGISGPTTKPLLMGEFGGFESDYWSPSVAAEAFQDWQVESCTYGFQGWLFWTWDTEVQPGAKLWTAFDGGGVVDNALSPVNRPDPCVSGSFSGQDVALNKPGTASNQISNGPPSLAFDGKIGTPWNSGDFPTQWIEVDLGAASSISAVRLVASQSPAGQTTHIVWGMGPGTGGVYKVLYQFSGTTSDGQVLEYTPAAAWTDIEYIKVETIRSPSWVAWYEIEVLRA